MIAKSNNMNVSTQNPTPIVQTGSETHESTSPPQSVCGTTSTTIIIITTTTTTTAATAAMHTVTLHVCVCEDGL